MGRMSHHTIVVTSWNSILLKEAHVKAEDIFSWVSKISPEVTNGYVSFFVPPDGSKEGWDESNTGNNERRVFLDWLDDLRYDDGSTSIQWVEVQFGDDYGDAKVTRDSDHIAGE